MAAFIAMTSWQGEFTDEYFAQPAPDPAAFGMPTEDDGSRDDPLLSDRSWAVSSYRPDVDALAAAPTRVVIAVGEESAGTFTGRTAVATAELLGQQATVFPSHHGGFLGGEFGYAGQPEAFARRLREVLDGGRLLKAARAGARGRSADALVDPDADGVARLLADRLAQRGPHGQPVRAVALRHQRALERLAVDRAADLHEPARLEELGRVVHHDARPCTWVVALLELGVEFSQHATETLANDRTHRRAGRVDCARTSRTSSSLRVAGTTSADGERSAPPP